MVCPGPFKKRGLSLGLGADANKALAQQGWKFWFPRAFATNQCIAGSELCIVLRRKGTKTLPVTLDACAAGEMLQLHGRPIPYEDAVIKDGGGSKIMVLFRVRLV